MSDQSPLPHLKVLFEAALRDYEIQTGIASLPEHPLAKRLQECDSVESITAVLHEQIQDYNEFRGKEKVINLLNNSVLVLYNISACANLGDVIGMVRLKALMGSFIRLTLIPLKFSPAEAINSGLAILLSVFAFLSFPVAHLCNIQLYQTIKGVKDSYDALVELLESIEHFLYRLDIYTKITPTIPMTEILVKILVQLLSTLALATKEVKQGKPSESVFTVILYIT